MIVVLIQHSDIVPELRNTRVLNSAYSEALKGLSKLTQLGIEDATRAPCFGVVVVVLDGSFKVAMGFDEFFIPHVAPAKHIVGGTVRLFQPQDIIKRFNCFIDITLLEEEPG